MEQDWILCSERMPEEHETMFAKLKGTDKWNNSMFEKCSVNVNVTSILPDGSRIVEAMHTIDGEWCQTSKIVKRNIIAWRPFPEAYNGPEISETEK